MVTSEISENVSVGKAEEVPPTNSDALAAQSPRWSLEPVTHMEVFT
jgi:hypothetical protein